VRVTDVSAVSGFVLPGMKVDVLVTGRPPNGADTITRTVLQNIEVLSVGTAIQADPRGQAIQSATINLLVFPEQAETLTLAGNEGRIQLVLRNGSDKNELKTTGTTINELYKGAGKAPVPVSEAKPRIIYRPAPRPVAPVEVKPVSLPPPPQVPEQIIVIRGDKRSVEVIKPAAPAAGAAPGQSDNN
jgi:pilus assembly protein CpaB